MMLQEWFHAILGLEPFSRARSHSSICRCSQEHSILNFRARLLPILFISSNSETATPFVCGLVHFNLPLWIGAILFEFSPAITSNIISMAKWCYWSDFVQFWDSKLFRAHAHTRLFVVAPDSSPFSIFARGHFQYYLFGLMMLLVRFRAILRHEPFSRARWRSSTCRCSRVHSFLNCHARSLPILFIWPNDATGAISRNSETPTIFMHTLLLVNLPLLPGALLFEF